MRNAIGNYTKKKGVIPLGNFIKIDRKILKWEWWSDINTFRLFFYMIISAYWKDGNYKGVEIKRGSFPSSISELSRETNLSVMEIRTALKHLQSTGEITTNQQATNKQNNTKLTSNLTSKKTNKFTIFTVVNYDLYQSDNKQNNTNLTSNLTENQQSTNTQLNKQLTRHILKEYKNEKNVKNEKKERKGQAVYYPNDELLNNAFKEFLTMRNKIKKPLATKQALTRMMNKIEKLSGGDNDLAIKILNQSTDHCWQDVYELKSDSGGNRNGNSGIDWDNV